MLGNAFGWPHLLVILAVILLLFGAAKLPALAKSVGQSARVFKGEMKAMKDDDVPADTSAPQNVSPQAAAPYAPTNNVAADPSVPVVRDVPSPSAGAAEHKP